MLRIGEMSELKGKVVNMGNQESPRLFEKYRKSSQEVNVDTVPTEENLFGQSSILYGLSSIHGGSLPLIGSIQRQPSNSNRMKKLFDGLKSICQDTEEGTIDLNIIGSSQR